MPAKGERIVVTYVLLKPEHVASHQHTLLNKKGFPVPAFAYPVRKRLITKGPDPCEDDTDMKELRLCADDTMDTKLTIPSRAPEVWEQRERDGHMPKFPDCPVCVQEHGSVVKHFSSTTNSLHTLHLDTCYWGDPNAICCRDASSQSFRVSVACTSFGEEVGMWRSHDKKQTKSAHHKGAVGRLIAIEPWGIGTCVLIAKGSDLNDPELAQVFNLRPLQWNVFD